MSTAITPYLEMSQAIAEAGGEALKKCYQCGTCTGTCPWAPITEFQIRKLIRLSQFGYDGIEDLMWGCTTCKFCVDRCPRGVEIIDLVKSIRNMYSEGGMLPTSLRSFVGKPLSKGKSLVRRCRKAQRLGERAVSPLRGRDGLPLLDLLHRLLRPEKCPRGQGVGGYPQSIGLHLGASRNERPVLRGERQKSRRFRSLRTLQGKQSGDFQGRRRPQRS